MSDTSIGDSDTSLEGLIGSTEPDSDKASSSIRSKLPAMDNLAANLAEVNKELWLILSLIGLAGLMNYLIIRYI